MISESEYLTLSMLNFIYLNIAEILNESEESYKTVCPSCHTDDFTHIEGCEMIAKVAEKTKDI